MTLVPVSKLFDNHMGKQGLIRSDSLLPRFKVLMKLFEM